MRHEPAFSILRVWSRRLVLDRAMSRAIVSAPSLLLAIMTSSSLAQEAVFRTHIGPSLITFGSAGSLPGEDQSGSGGNGSEDEGENIAPLSIDMPSAQLAGRAPATVNVDVVLSGGDGEYTVEGDLIGLTYVPADTHTGVIVGQLNETSPYSLTVTDGSGSSTSKSILLGVFPPLQAYLQSMPVAVRPGEAVDVLPQVSGQIGTHISWQALVARGLQVDAQTGALTGVAGAPGSLHGIRLVAQDSADGATAEVAFDIPVIADPISISVANSVWRAGMPVSPTYPSILLIPTRRPRWAHSAQSPSRTREHFLRASPSTRPPAPCPARRASRGRMPGYPSPSRIPRTAPRSMANLSPSSSSPFRKLRSSSSRTPAPERGDGPSQ